MYRLILILFLVFGPLDIKACPHLYYTVPYSVAQPVPALTLQRPTMPFMQQQQPMQQMPQMQQTPPVQQQTQQQSPMQETQQPTPQQNHQHQSDCDNKCNKLLSTLLKLPTDVATNMLSGGLPL